MKSQKLFFKVGALAIALIMCIGVFAACKPAVDPNGTKNPQNTQSAEDVPLVIAYQQFSEKFSPFFASTGYDTDVASMTQLGLMTTDRVGAIVYNGIEGEDREYNGTTYHYDGISDLTVTPGADTTTYTIKMKEGIKFSDGVDATIDDVIFYYYVILDPAYDGSSTLSSQNIVGYENYRYNNAKAETINWLDALSKIDDDEPLQEAVAKQIIQPLLDAELDWVQTLYTNAKYTGNATWGPRLTENPDRKDVMYTFFYGTDENYDPKSHTEAEVMAKLYEEYGYDYKLMGDAYAGDESNLVDQKMQDVVYNVELEKLGDVTEVPNVTGIKKIDNYTVEVTTRGFSANAVYHIGGATVAPMHYYGDASLYDYEKNMFGFNSRQADAMTLIKKHIAEPMGAGAYKFVEFKDKVVYFERNELYYKGVPKTKYIQFKETAGDDMVLSVATGSTDAASDITGTVQRFAEIAGYNTDTNAETGNTITTSAVWNLGYGYIGLNAGTVKVGEGIDPTVTGSEASKNLRKALATVLSVYRVPAIDSYYGTVAAVIEYPISTTSWAAPQTADEGYTLAFSKDVTGKEIYTATMTQEQKEAAALEAAIGFFKAAGYTFDEATGKFTAAPEGAKLDYEIIIPGDNKGDHPNYAVAYNASQALKNIGITLTVNDPADANVLWKKLDAGTQELWTAAWSSTIDPDMYQVYHSDNRKKDFGGAANSTGSNNYQIADTELNNLIMEARSSSDQSYRKTIYKQCLDIIMDWGVEVPAYQRKNVVIFSTERVKLSSITPDITTYWGWMNDIELIEMNPAA